MKISEQIRRVAVATLKNARLNDEPALAFGSGMMYAAKLADVAEGYEEIKVEADRR